MNDNRIVLTGTVASDQAKQRAKRYAMQVRGVEKVDNQLRVDAQASQQTTRTGIDDSTLAKQIAEKLVRDVFSDAKADDEWLFGWEVEGDNFEFDIDVDDGDVTLEGSVPHGAQYSEILKAVRSVPGVRTVDLDLSPPTYSNRYSSYPNGYSYYPYHPYYGPPSVR